MVKSLTAIALSFLLLLGAALFESFYVEKKFSTFAFELEELIDKTEDDASNEEDAKAVQTSWESLKKDLYALIPHSDISRIDDYMSETVRLIGEKEKALALSKLEILLHLTKCLPGTYRPAVENIF